MIHGKKTQFDEDWFEYEFGWRDERGWMSVSYQGQMELMQTPDGRRTVAKAVRGTKHLARALREADG